ncbi:MAG TPA: glutamine--fructose-6-phosphate transaminase (isomerizing) [Phycisphaerae bacterium]|nr:glutamine--fructose-6-phosphate transaminase (isomerizing) [Phycisphaerae bacterium]
MCGIVGYIGNKQAYPILLEGLKRLEYRGYDSAGVAIQQGGDGRLMVVKSKGRISQLEARMQGREAAGTLGIAHTRWATHGAPNDVNAHPHTDASGRLAVVHNGIVENWSALRQLLESEGVVFRSDTDTEVLAHLFARHYKGDLEKAVQQGLQEVRGAYGIAVIHADEPDVLVAARNGSPLIIGVGEGEYIVASDASAIIEHTTNVIYLEDSEMATVRRGGLVTSTIDAVPTHKEVQQVEWSLAQIEKKGYPHFMLKEIMEQPESLSDTMRGRLDVEAGEVHLGGINDVAKALTHARRVILAACGTAWHAGLVGEFLFEDLARIPTEVEYASEFRYRNPIVDEGTVVICISQSGETADTLAAMREARLKGALALGIVNVVGSTIARETDAGVYLHCGPEIGVASTKAFSSQLVVLIMTAMFLGRRRHLAPYQAREIIKGLQAVPGQVRRVLALDEQIQTVAAAYKDCPNWLYLGRGYNYPVALEGALKLKEISYIHAEGLPAAEMKHGPIALITEEMPVVFLANRGLQYEKVLSNMEEVRSRGGQVIAVATEGDEEIRRLARHVLYVPDVPEPFQPILNVVPLQLLAYHVAVLRGCAVDKPRNLAKSVTVE